MAREEGISRITMWPLETDKVGSKPTFGELFPLPWAVNFETEDEYREGQYYGDNIVEQSKKSISKVTVDMEVSSDTPPSLDAKITGKGYKGGMSYKNTGDKTPAYAVGYEILMSDGNLRRRIIYNVGFTRNSHTNKTIEDEAEGQTYTYSGVGLPLASTGDVEAMMDLAEIAAVEAESEKTWLKERWDKFFESPVLPEEYTPSVVAAKNK